MSIQLEKALDRLTKNEYKNDITINGRPYGTGELQPKYRVSIDENSVFILEHWGTPILELALPYNKVISYYGESKSDCDSIVQAFNYFDVTDYNVSFRPSTDTFALYKNDLSPYLDRKIKLDTKKGLTTGIGSKKLVELIGNVHNNDHTRVCEYMVVADNLVGKGTELLQLNRYLERLGYRPLKKDSKKL